MSKVFLSYSHRNEEFMQTLYKRLIRDGVDCFFDKESIAWGENWVVALENGIDDCEFIVLLLTPEYCESEWSKLERTSAMADDPAGLKTKIRPLLLEPCGDRIPRFLKPIQYIDVSIPENFEKNYPKICEDLGGTVIEKHRFADRSSLPPAAKLPVRSRMPFRSLSNGFVGRIQDLWDIDDILRSRHTAVVEGVGIVSGTGGIGKTQLAIEYVHRFGVNYPGGVFWIDADQGTLTMLDQVSQAAGIGIDNTLEQNKQLEQLWKQLVQFPAVLIVLDNFPEEELIQAWLPPHGSIHTLVTTRRRDLANFSRLNLDFMSDKEGLALLNSGDRKFGPEATDLVELLDGLPLAMELAKNFLNLRPALTIADLLAEIQKIGQIQALDIFTKRYANELPSGHTKEVAATFQLGWDLASSNARSVLRCMALLAPAPVPRQLLINILDFPSKTILEDPFDEAISELHSRLSLVERDRDNDPWMHRLISAFVRNTSEGLNELFESAFQAVKDEMARAADEKDIQSYRELEKILPHAEHLLFSEWIHAEQAIDLSNYILRHYTNTAKYRLAEEYGRKALKISEDNFKPGHPSIATSQSNLALVLQDLGELEEARDLLRQALESDQNSFEPGHPSIAIRQSNLALVLQDLGELEEARDLLRQALESDQNSFEPGHPSIAIRQSNLALVLQDLGELEEARDLLRQALESDQNSFEPGHPSIAIRQSNLALVLQDLGELEEARDLLRQALESDQNSFKPGHPSIATSQSNLALVLQDLGELEEARDLLRQALESDQNSFEPGHPSIAISQSNLALVLQDLGELEEARDLLRQALESDQNSFEPGHPSIARSQSNLATVLKDLGELEEARDLLRQALESDQNSFEPGHPSIAIRQSNLALVLQDLGELEEARDLLRQALESDQNSFEPGHPSIAIRQSNLALVLQDLGELEEAEDLAQKAYETFLARFGPEHSYTITTKKNLDIIKNKFSRSGTKAISRIFQKLNLLNR